MSNSSRTSAAVGALALGATGTWLLLTSIQNNRYEGWGMLVRALAGHAAWIASADCGARAMGGSPRRARIVAAKTLSLVLTPCTAIVFLMSKESGPSWSTAAMVLFAWFAVTGVVAFRAGHRQ